METEREILREREIKLYHKFEQSLSSVKDKRNILGQLTSLNAGLFVHFLIFVSLS